VRADPRSTDRSTAIGIEERTAERALVDLPWQAHIRAKIHSPKVPSIENPQRDHRSSIVADCSDRPSREGDFPSDFPGMTQLQMASIGSLSIITE